MKYGTWNRITVTGSHEILTGLCGEYFQPFLGELHLLDMNKIEEIPDELPDHELLAGYIDWYFFSKDLPVSALVDTLASEDEDWKVWATNFSDPDDLSEHIREQPTDKNIKIGATLLKSADADYQEKAWLGWYLKYWGTDEPLLHCHLGEVSISTQRFGEYALDIRFDTAQENLICDVLSEKFPELQFRSVSCDLREGRATLKLFHKGSFFIHSAPIFDELFQMEFDYGAYFQDNPFWIDFMETFPSTYFCRTRRMNSHQT